MFNLYKAGKDGEVLECTCDEKQEKQMTAKGWTRTKPEPAVKPDAKPAAAKSAGAGSK